MFKKIDLRDFEATEGIIVFDGTVFADAFTRNQKNAEYSLKSVYAISTGKIPGVITDLEMGKVRRLIGFKNTEKLFEGEFHKNPNCVFYEIMMAGHLDDYRDIPAYCKLFNLCSSTNLHMPDLTSVVASIETNRPLVTNDFHHWQQQSNIRKAYREKYAERRASEMIQRSKKLSDMKMYDSKDFCCLVLKP